MPEFDNKDQFLEHIQEEHGTEFRVIVIIAAQMKAAGMSVMSRIIRHDPAGFASTAEIMSSLTATVLHTLMTFADQREKIDELLAAADRLLDYADAEVTIKHAMDSAARSSGGDRPSVH